MAATKGWQRLEPALPGGAVLLYTGDHLLVALLDLPIRVESALRNGATILEEALGEPVVFPFDSFVFAFAVVDIQGFCLVVGYWGSSSVMASTSRRNRRGLRIQQRSAA